MILNTTFNSYDIDINKSLGCWLFLNGKYLLDMTGMLATQPLGINPDIYKSDEFLYDISQLSFNKIPNRLFESKYVRRFIDYFGEEYLPNYDYVIFTESGSLAVDNSVKIAFDRSDIDIESSVILSILYGYHGRSGYATSLTSSNLVKVNGYPKYNWPSLSIPSLQFPLEDNRKINEINRGRSIEELYKVISLYKNRIVAIIFEPILSDGGDIHIDPSILLEIDRICKKNNIVFIVDEIQTGMYITGYKWLYEYYGLDPDILLFSKKAQISGTAVKSRILNKKDNTFTVNGRLGSTWHGHTIDYITGYYLTKEVRKTYIIDNIKMISSYILNSLSNLSTSYPITNIRGIGLLIGFDLPNLKLRNSLITLLRQYVFIIACGKKSIRLRPSYIITIEDIDFFIDKLYLSLSQLF